MRIAQILLPDASEYERKSQRADFAALVAAQHDVRVLSIDDARQIDADVAHVYASAALPPSRFVAFPVPYVSSMPLATSRWWMRKAVAPSMIAGPFGEKPLPEAVEDEYWLPVTRGARGTRNIVGSFGRKTTRNMVEQTLHRIHRFRDDVTWRELDHRPTREDLSGVDIWVDPAMEESDLDGFVAEALVVGLPVVAARIPINAMRLEQGRTGWLVPPRDPNEMTHAILAALFKPEVAENKLAAARQTISKFKSRQRMRLLGALYETINR